MLTEYFFKIGKLNETYSSVYIFHSQFSTIALLDACFLQK